MSVRFAPIRLFVNLSREPSTCFLRMHAWEYFILRGSSSDQLVCIGSPLVDGSVSVLEFFFGLCNSTSSSLLIMMSLFVYWCFGCGQTDWDSQYSSLEEVYCATIALGRYSSHSGKIHYIQDGNLCLYMQHNLRQTLAIYTPGLVTPSIHVLLAKFASV